jgi:hypothetical protein
MRPFEAVEIIKQDAFTEFDHNLLSTFIKMLGPNEDTTH